MAEVPQPVTRVTELLVGFKPDWALCGGWAVDAWVGRQTRDHLDVDLLVFDEDQGAVHGFFRTGWLLNGHDVHDDDSTHAWDGRRLVLPAHIHARANGFELDVQLNRRAGGDWRLGTTPEVRIPLSQAIRRSAWGVPTVAPELLLLYKATSEIRAHDEADFRALLPLLSPAERGWLRAAIAALHPDHDWLGPLG